MGNPLSRFFRSFRRSLIAWTLVVVAFWPFMASPAQAQMVVVDVQRQADTILETIFTSLSRAAMVGLFNAFQTFLGQLAYDAADYIATGGSGQSATFYKKGPGQYFQDVASDAAGEFIGSLSNEDFFRTAGFNLCRPDARVLLRVQLSLGNFFPGLQGRFQRPQPKCDFKDIVNNYDQLYQSLTNDDVLKNVQLGLNTSASDLGVTFNLLNQFSKKIATNVNDSLLARTEGGGFKSVNNLLSGNIKTPSQVVNEVAREQLVRFPNQSLLTTVGATLSSGLSQGFVQLLAYTSSIFVNTLTSKLLRRVFEGGLDSSVAQIQLESADFIPDRRQADARNINVSLKTPNLQRVENFDVLAELAACPADTRGTWNCAMDQGLRSALVRSDQGGMTVQAAISANLLHGDWQLIPSSDTRRNQDKNCYTSAYCAGNLQKLRVLRILSSGFEIAANSPENVRRCSPQGSGCVTLQEVVDGFNQCGGTAPSPWCRMIDPNWILTSLPQQCVLDGYSDQLISSTLGQRRQQCQDVQTCLRRNDQGECIGGYGYCVAEKSVYRFGADECLSREASCRTYQPRTGQSVSYLRNTTDQAACSAENVGCLWYSSARNPSLGTEAWIGTTSTGARVYFDSQVATCGAAGEGCTKVKEAVVGRSSLNLVINPSFEAVTEAAGSVSLNDWIVTPAAYASRAGVVPTTTVGTPALIGVRAVDTVTPTGAVPTYSQPLTLSPGRAYTLSLFARAKTATGPAPRVNTSLSQYAFVDNAYRLVSVEGAYRSSGCVRPSTNASIVEPRTGGQALGVDWQRYECTFVTASTTMSGLLQVQGENILLDAIQVEESEYATDFVEGLNQSLAERHLKIAPDEFACAGTDSDHPFCDRFAKVCRQTEAGCNGYTDVQGSGSEVPAILSTNDLCPTQCVGYSEYKKGPSAFDLVADADTRFSDPGDASSTYFIPSTAAVCRQEEVGCEAFTNVEGASGEQQAYFSYARSCRKPGPDAQTFFTWEGSDSAGYQLRTWSLVRDASTPSAPLIVAKREPGRLTLKEPATCNEATWRTALDPDCRQFYDAEGNTSYRYYSQTVLSTPSCTDFRVARTNRADCEKTDGVFDAGANECLYRVFVPQSRVCSAAAVGCREYRGSTSGAMLPILSETFRNATGSGIFSSGRVSNESLLVGDQSLRIDVGARNPITVSAPFVTPQADTIYNVTFWAKPALASSTLQLTVRDPANTGRPPIFAGTVALGTDWQRYTVGPFNGYPGAVTSSLAWTAPGLSNAYVVFLDEIVITRVQDVVYARRDSWSTPEVCNQNAYGVPQPQAMLGCRTYRNRQQQTVNVRQFTQLCREAAIGCKGFVDTRNSDSVAAETFVRGDSPPVAGFGVATTTRSPDRMIYLIDEPSKRCTADQNSCRAFGKPQFSADRQEITGFTTVYLKDDITAYSRSLCRPSELFCEEFTYNGSKEYFRTPDTHTCEYREDVTDVVGMPEGRYSGWFEANSAAAKPCYPELLASGQAFGVARRADPMYRGWVGTCSPSADACTELRDPADTSNADNPSGKPYYFIRNDRLDTASCAGNVDPGNGCILVRDTSDLNNRYNARASYARQQAAPSLDAVQPVDCVRNPTDPNCRAQVGRCSGRIRHCLSSLVTPATFSSACAGVAGVNDFSLTEWEVRWRDNPELTALSVCRTDDDCTDAVPRSLSLPRGGDVLYQRTGTCEVANDTNLIVKVKMDRDCAQWLGCSSSEVVADPATNRARNLCTNIALCDEGSQNNNDPYCTKYVDRSSTSTEPILARGQALTSSVYTSRAVGLGEKDYAGYAIPNAFLTTDLVNARVAVEGNQNIQASGEYARDYRLAAAVPMPRAVSVVTAGLPCSVNGACFQQLQEPLPTQARILDRRSRLGAANPELHLCQHLQTGLIGYFIPSQVGVTSTSQCYLAASFDPLTLGDPEVRRSPFDFSSLVESFTGKGSTQNAFVRQAFPIAECRAYPQPDAPFPDTYATRWDLTKSPPKPLERLAGYNRVNVCEYGEDCSCSYKRADYREAAVSKFYNTASQDIPTGVCVGGPRDGQGCIPGVVLSIGAAPGTAGGGAAAPAAGGGASVSTRQRIVEASNASQSCGDATLGGRCVALTSVETVRGVFGQCLERDVTRSVRLGTTTEQPCLTWSPGPILFGEKDVYHYAPSAGYSPPPSSGQYYCTSSARKPRTLRLEPVDFEGSSNPASSTYAGRMRGFYYDDLWTSDEGTSDASLDGVSTDGSLVAQQCEDTDDDQDNDNSQSDLQGLRLVGTGHSIDTSYAETFFKINAPAFVSRLYNSLASNSEVVRTGLSDANIGYIKVAPFENKNGIGRLACGYQADWVDNLQSLDYDNLDQSRQADQMWRQSFFSTYNPIMTRSTEKLLKGRNTDGSPTDTPIAMDCVDFKGIEPSHNRCYFKTWEVGHRLEGQTQAFSRMVFGNSPINSFDSIRQQPDYQRCESDKPYFGIRAVFQTNADEAYQGASAADFASSGQTPRGPWRFVGFWVATCAGAANDVRYMYMNVDITSADICKELAEVRSHDSFQDAAFTDRVWKEGSFTVPRIGLPYGTRFSPFASALTTRSIGNDDQSLFQTGQDLAGFSPLNKPTFIASGADTYYRADLYPKDKWAYLSNLFARVYRIYRYESEPVNFTSNACLYGPFKGRACIPSNATVPAGRYPTGAMCSLDGECDTSALAREDLSDIKVCDALSGVNAGLSCGDDPDVCHTGAVLIDPVSQERKQLLAECGVNTSSWAKRRICDRTSVRVGQRCSNDTECGGRPGSCIEDPRQVYDDLSTPGTFEEISASEASSRFTSGRSPAPFVCKGGMRLNESCSAPTPGSGSRECPVELAGKCVKNPFQRFTPPSPSNPITLGDEQTRFAQAGRCAFPKLDDRGNPVRVDASQATRADAPTGPGSEVTYPDGSVYIVNRSEEYEDCFADYDCSFDQNNYYLKRASGYPTIYSPRSYFYQAQRPSDYGVTGSPCAPGSPDIDKSCLYSMKVDVTSCGGGADDAGTIGTRIPAGPSGYGECTLRAWRYGYNSTGLASLPAANQKNDCSIPEFEERLAGPAEWNRFPGFVKTSTYEQLQVLGLNLNILRDARGELRSLRDWSRENVEYAFIVYGVTEAIDSIVDGIESVVTYAFECTTASTWQQINFGSCISPALATGRGNDYGRCKGGVFDGKICRVGVSAGSKYSCKLDPTTPLKPDGSPVTIPTYTPMDGTGRQQVVSPARTATNVAQYEAIINACGPVSYTIDTVRRLYRPVAECSLTGPTDTPNATTNLDEDNNICTHGVGYRPRIDICPDATDEFCGLIAYRRRDVSSLSPRLSPYPLPTDVTMGLYTPDYLLTGTRGGDGSGDFAPSNFSYISTYKPQPPVIAAVNVSQCREAGQCAVTRVNAFTFNGQTEGPITIAGGQHKSTIQFYGWAAHNQMPIRKLVIDWGDGFKQSLPDAKIKNRKPMCGGTKECVIPAGPNRGPTGLTCNSDLDCPGGYGRCEAVGTCTRNVDRVCTQDTDCFAPGEARDVCNIRTFFGNSTDACEPNYFEFSHVYSCNGPATVGGVSNVCNPSGATGFRCSGNPEVRCTGASDTTSCAAGDRCIQDLATKNGCWDPVTNSCRFTPRVLIEDNWGWCTGECRTVNSPTGPTDALTSNVLHPYGGCYAGVPLGASESNMVRLNNGNRLSRLTPVGECTQALPDADAGLGGLRPWVVYPGSLQLRSRR
jgi:hypothetical protein